MSNPRFSTVSLVKAGANERDFAIVRKGLLEMVQLNPSTKASVLKMLASVVEKMTALMQVIQGAAEDANAPTSVPAELQAELVKLGDEFTSAIVAMVPEAAPDANAAPVPVAPQMSADEKLQMLIGQMQAMIAELEQGGIAKSATVAAVAKGLSLKKSVYSMQKIYNDGFTKFLSLLLELLPLVMAMQDANIEVVDPTAAPVNAAPGGASPPVPTVESEEMAKAVATVVAKALEPISAQINTIGSRVEAVAKARPISGSVNDDGAPSPRKPDTYVENFTEKLRREGKIA